jgi:hypothetical protein
MWRREGVKERIGRGIEEGVGDLFYIVGKGEEEIKTL